MSASVVLWRKLGFHHLPYYRLAGNLLFPLDSFRSARRYYTLYAKTHQLAMIIVSRRCAYYGISNCKSMDWRLGYSIPTRHDAPTQHATSSFPRFPHVFPQSSTLFPLCIDSFPRRFVTFYRNPCSTVPLHCPVAILYSHYTLSPRRRAVRYSEDSSRLPAA